MPSNASSRHARSATVDRFAASINDALEILADRASEKLPRETGSVDALPSLLEQCRSISKEGRNSPAEPIRTIHHFACTGGTLLTKCIASLPNTQLLNEVDPLSKLREPSIGEFTPTNLIQLVRNGTRSVDDAVLIDIFLRGVESIYDYARRKGLRLIIRDHAHSLFCIGTAIEKRPTLREMLETKHRVRSIITVRNPVDSYLSLMNNGWEHFEPFNINEYALRYMSFLDRYDGIKIVKYEDFVADPYSSMREIADAIELPYAADFRDIFYVHRLSGDSGRKSPKIEEKTRRSVSESMHGEILNSSVLNTLCNRLGYEPE